MRDPRSRREYDKGLPTLGPDSIFVQQSTTPEEIAYWRIPHDALRTVLNPSFLATRTFNTIQSMVADLKAKWTEEASQNHILSGHRNWNRELSLRVATATALGYDLSQRQIKVLQPTLDRILKTPGTDSSRKVLVDLIESIITERERIQEPWPEDGLSLLIKTQRESALQRSWIYDQITTIFLAGEETTRA